MARPSLSPVCPFSIVPYSFTVAWGNLSSATQDPPFAVKVEQVLEVRGRSKKFSRSFSVNSGWSTTHLQVLTALHVVSTCPQKPSLEFDEH